MLCRASRSSIQLYSSVWELVGFPGRHGVSQCNSYGSICQHQALPNSMPMSHWPKRQGWVECLGGCFWELLRPAELTKIDHATTVGWYTVFKALWPQPWGICWFDALVQGLTHNGAVFLVMQTYVYIQIYINLIELNISTHTHMCIFIFTYIYSYIYAHIHIYIYAFIYLCLYLHIYI